MKEGVLFKLLVFLESFDEGLYFSHEANNIRLYRNSKRERG